jgi:hypothetical protein
MDKVTAGSEPTFIERRHDARLRAICPHARSHIAHLFHGSRDWVEGTLEYLAQRVVHEAYPDLCAAEVRILITAIECQMAGEARQCLAE